ncbi:IS200/IS605 family transposase [Pirellulaceae bacterium SH449]
MANTFTQIHIHAVFTVQERACLIRDSWQEELYKYITGIVQNHGHKMICINGMPDHVHCFFGMRPSQSLSDLMQAIKGDSSQWINRKGWIRAHFKWQEGFGAFSYSRSQVPSVVKYIENQKEHHRKVSFINEYHNLLRKFEVPFEERYSFVPIEYDQGDVH